MAARAKTDEGAQSTRQRLSAVIKRARDIMRTDPGLNGDLDRLPQLAWLLFLKAFDDLEEQRAVLDLDYAPLLPEGYRWRDWVGNARRTGDALRDFVNDDLLPKLRELKPTSSTRESADVVSSVFRGIENRMRSGYQIRALVDELDKVHFTSSDDIHTMAYLYESMLREMRDAAGDSGEFYTPRPVIRFMVNQVAPRLGEVVLDPAAGTGGFLVETLEHLRPGADSVPEQMKLYRAVRGYEKKPLPYLLATMNLLLHQVDVPHLLLGNALTEMGKEKSKASQVDVVLTNPPFGGAESTDVVKVFPTAFQTAETAWLFLYAVIEKLKPGGRCGMVVPNGFLFDGAVGARVKERLFSTCDVHTVVRLPEGVFAPYTPIPSNLLFFEKGRATQQTWFFEVEASGGRKRYSKTLPMRFEDFAECQQWWGGEDRQQRGEHRSAWRVPIEDIRDRGYILDSRNPRAQAATTHRSASQIVEELAATAQRTLATIEKLRSGLEASRRAKPSERRLGHVLTPVSRPVDVDSDEDYPIAGVYSFGKGILTRGTIKGSETKYAKLYELRADDFVLSRLKAFEGAVAIVDQEFDGFFVSQEFPTLEVDTTQCSAAFLRHICRWPTFWARLASGSKGIGSRRERVHVDQLLATKIPLPALRHEGGRPSRHAIEGDG